MKILRVALLIPWILILAAPAEPAGPARARLSKRERIALCEKKKDVPFAPSDPRPLQLPDPRIKRPVLIHRTDFLKEMEVSDVRGFVLLEAVIDEDGCVRQPKVIKGAGTLLANAAVKSVRRWVFEPATRDGRPVRLKYLLTVNVE
jgi:TonB family protein